MKKIKMNINSIGMWIVLVTIVGLVAFSGCTDQEETVTEKTVTEKTDTEKIEIEQKLVIAEPWGISGVEIYFEAIRNFYIGSGRSNSISILYAALYPGRDR